MIPLFIEVSLAEYPEGDDNRKLIVLDTIAYIDPNRFEGEDAGATVWFRDESSLVIEQTYDEIKGRIKVAVDQFSKMFGRG